MDSALGGPGGALAGAAIAVLELARRTPNRGDRHIILGDPWSDGVDKTVVEPGGSFSPGVWTCGVSAWFTRAGRVISADLFDSVPADLGFGEDGIPPVVTSSVSAGGLQATIRVASVREGGSTADAMIIDSGAGDASTTHVVVRGIGPAGGRLTTATPHGRRLDLGGGRWLTFDPAPERIDVEPAADGVLAVATWGGSPEVGVVAEHGWADRPGGALLSTARPFASASAGEVIERSRQQWAGALPAVVYGPDPAVRAIWEGSAHHLMAQAELGVPLIGAVDYPVGWVRDSVAAIRALDVLGRHDLARTGIEFVTQTVFTGGFGAEADAPGQGIWAIAEHGALTGDIEWLDSRYDRIRERTEWLDRMRGATEPLRALAPNRMPRYWSTPAINLVCAPSEGGLIRGRMDWHSPDLYINAWARAGYDSAATAAELLGRHTDAAAWLESGREVESALHDRLLPDFGNERDPAVVPYPTGLIGEPEDTRHAFERWYRAHRLDADGKRTPEELWTYFEAAQAHNAIRLGLVEEAWTSLRGMFSDDDAWRSSAFGEGRPGGAESIPFRNDHGANGWLNPERARHGNMPHIWTAAELVAALRTVFVMDDGDELVLGAGVPKAWAQPGARFGATDLPTRLGRLSYSAEFDGQEWRFDVDTASPWRAAIPGTRLTTEARK